MVDTAATGTVTVWIPGELRKRTGNRNRVSVQAGTVREVIDTLERDFPGIRFNICHETGDLRSFVNVFVGQEEVRCLQGLDTRVPPGETMYIIHSVAGG
jgi:molybdopterin synthase sulfur carrier subunit